MATIPLLLDPERATYEAYGLGSSFIRVWSPKVMWHYLKLVLAGQKLQPVQGDPHQLGGDVIVDKEPAHDPDGRFSDRTRSADQPQPGFQESAPSSCTHPMTGA